MKRLQNISDDPIQRHIILFEDSEITFTLRFYPTIAQWCFDVNYKDFNLYGVKLSLGTLHMRSNNQPFDFWVDDTSASGLDPYRINDFLQERCVIYLLEAEDMQAVRGVPVPI